MKNKVNLRGTLYVTDWLSDISYVPEGGTELVQVLFKNTRSAFFRNPDKLPIKKGDWVVVEASPGYDIGKVMLTGPLVHLQMKKAGNVKDSDIKAIHRIATEADISKFEEARAREHTTMIRSRQIAADLGLNMKIGDVEFQGDGTKAIFYYIADERVDFRKLIRILADTFKIRIEMKQIGARQEAGRIGGIGPCGRPLCCSTWMSRFVSVGTGAARIQDLSMNPQKLAGQCGKLKCCLNFETDAYAEAAGEFPPKDVVLITQDQEYYQFKTDILARTISYSTDKHAAVNLVTISTDRAKEIIAMNRQGQKPEQLLTETPAAEPNQEYVELVGQDSLTRFDKKKKKKKGKANAETAKDENLKQKDNSTKQKEGQSSKQKGHPNQKQNGPQLSKQKDRQNPKHKDSPAQKQKEQQSPKKAQGNGNEPKRFNNKKKKQQGLQKGNEAPAGNNQPSDMESGPVRKNYFSPDSTPNTNRKS